MGRMARRRTTGPDPRIEALRDAPPARFVAARDALARALAGEGDPRAAEVRALRRPTRRSWMLNRVARARRDDVDALLQTGARVRAAHAGVLRGRRDADLRAADDALNAALDRLVQGARAVATEAGMAADHALLVGLREDLRALATGEAGDVARLRAGAVERAPAREPGAIGWGLGPSTPVRSAGLRSAVARGSRHGLPGRTGRKGRHRA